MLLVIMLSDNQHWYCPMLVIILSDNRPSKSVVIEEYDLVYPGKVADGWYLKAALVGMIQPFNLIHAACIGAP